MNNHYSTSATCREIPDLEENEYLSLDGEVIEFDEIEWLEGSDDCSRFLVDGDSVWLNQDFQEVEA